jgi:hypothetical protein
MLQVALPDWLGRLPHSLTQLVLSPIRLRTEDGGAQQGAGSRAGRCGIFLRSHLPALCALRHLAFHGLEDISKHFPQQVFTVAGALPHLISLHLVRL